MFHSKPKNLSTVLELVPTQVHQLCTFENLILDDQVTILNLVGTEVSRLYPHVNIFITMNPSPSGFLYASLDISEEDLEINPTIEAVVDSITPLVESIIYHKNV